MVHRVLKVVLVVPKVDLRGVILVDKESLNLVADMDRSKIFNLDASNVVITSFTPIFHHTTIVLFNHGSISTLRYNS